MNPEQQNNLQPSGEPSPAPNAANQPEPNATSQPVQSSIQSNQTSGSASPLAPPVPLNFTAPPVETDAVLPAQAGVSNAKKKAKKKIGIIIGSACTVLVAVIVTIVIINANKNDQPKPEENPSGTRYIDVIKKEDEKLDEDDDDEIPEGMEREKVANLKSGKIKLNYVDDSTGKDATLSEDDEDDDSVLYNGAYFVDGTYVSIKSGTFNSNVENQAVFVVANGGILKLSKDVKVNKTASATNDPDVSLADLGTNAAIVVFGENSKVFINGSEINTTAKSAKAIYGAKGSKIEVKSATINTTNNAASGVTLTFGAALEANASIIKTGSANSPGIESKFGAGNITATNLNVTTNGLESPIVTTVSQATLNSVSGTANGSQMLIVEGEGSVVLDSSKLSANGHGGTKDNTENAAVLFRKSLRSEALEVATGISSEPVDTPASFTAKDSEFSILTSSNVYTSAPIFRTLTKNVNISIENSRATFSEDAKLLMATSATVNFEDKNFTTMNKYYEADESSVVTGLEEKTTKEKS